MIKGKPFAGHISIIENIPAPKSDNSIEQKKEVEQIPNLRLHYAPIGSGTARGFSLSPSLPSPVKPDKKRKKRKSENKNNNDKSNKKRRSIGETEKIEGKSKKRKLKDSDHDRKKKKRKLSKD